MTLQGYFDGNEIQTKDSKKQSARGLLSKYANPKLQKEEESAWEKAVEEKYDK